ncbi:growth hormone secretagogue receptor type 1 [Biomphalaria glabrata]|nr:growth hormone secretagogue receptor type 1 [Biomphalaria glabrata]
MSESAMLVYDDYDKGSLYISDNALEVFILVVNIVVLGLIALTGVISNVINMVIFVKQVLKDSMTVGLFALAFTDFSVTTLELSISCIYVASVLYPESPVDLWALAYISFAWAVYALYLTSCWITAMIAVERCFCVVFPFQVKQIFTKSRCVLVIFIIYAIHISTFIPVFVIEKMEWVLVESPKENASLSVVPETWVYTVVFSDATDEVEAAMDIAGGMFLFMTSQLVLYVCSVWMTVSLKLSSTVRTARLLSDEKLGNDSKMTLQEKRLVKMVLFLTLLQSACNLPRLAITIFYHAFPGISIELHRNFSTVVWTSSVVINNISCSCNSLGYYFLNSNYRKTFRKIFEGHVSSLVQSKISSIH